MVGFIYKCLASTSSLVTFVARHGILYGRMHSTIGRNVLSCCLRYSTNTDSIANRLFRVDNINKAVEMSDEELTTASLLYKNLFRVATGHFN